MFKILNLSRSFGFVFAGFGDDDIGWFDMLENDLSESLYVETLVLLMREMSEILSMMDESLLGTFDISAWVCSAVDNEIAGA
jgi:hypothetical protein